MFERPHHQRIAQVLLALNGPLLREHCCLFGGGTAVALHYGEFRESVDIDFLVSDVTCYRQLRLLLTESQDGIAAILRKNVKSLTQTREIRADQYGIRTMLLVAGRQIKFEIILEGRIKLDRPGEDDEICDIATLSPLDLVTSKLLANSDRWADDGAFSRDLIDLAMMQPSLNLFHKAVMKAEQAYGKVIVKDIDKAIEKLQTRRDWLERCMKAMAINIPKALLWERVRALKRFLSEKDLPRKTKRT
jgi:hypothetical protein